MEINQQKERTAKDLFKDLANKNTCTQEEEKIVQYVLRKIGFPEAVVTCGIVYLNGYGSISSPPTDINSIAKMILKVSGQEE